MNRTTFFCKTAGILALACICSSAHGAVKTHVHKTGYSSAKKPTLAAPQAVKAPSFALPADAVLLTEVNLSESNLLDMLKKSIPKMSQAMSNIPQAGPMMKGMRFDQLYDCIKGLKAVRFANFQLKETPCVAVPGGKEEMPNIEKAYAFFDRQVNRSQGWDRIIYRSNVPGEDVIAVYAKGNSLLGVVMSTKSKSDVMFGTAGFVDVPKFIEWAGNVASIVMNNMDKDSDDDDDASAKPSSSNPPSQPAAPSPAVDTTNK